MLFVIISNNFISINRPIVFREYYFRKKQHWIRFLCQHLTIKMASLYFRKKFRHYIFPLVMWQGQLQKPVNSPFMWFRMPISKWALVAQTQLRLVFEHLSKQLQLVKLIKRSNSISPTTSKKTLFANPNDTLIASNQ